DGQRWVADGRTFGSRVVAGGCGEIGARALERVEVAVALGALHRERFRGDELVDRTGAVIVQGGEAALGLGDLQEVAANAGEADGLGGSRSRVGGGHLFQRILIDAERN